MRYLRTRGQRSTRRLEPSTRNHLSGPYKPPAPFDSAGLLSNMQTLPHPLSTLHTAPMSPLRLKIDHVIALNDVHGPSCCLNYKKSNKVQLKAAYSKRSGGLLGESFQISLQHH